MKAAQKLLILLLPITLFAAAWALKANPNGVPIIITSINGEKILSKSDLIKKQSLSRPEEIQARLSLRPATEPEDNYLYIPYAQGQLSLTLNNQEIYSSEEKTNNSGPQTLENHLIRIPRTIKPADDLTISLKSGPNLYTRLSDVFQGSKNSFEGRYLFHNWYYGELRQINFTALILLGALLLIIKINRSLPDKYNAILVATVYLITVQTVQKVPNFEQATTVNNWLLAFAPAIIFNFTNSTSNKINSDKLKIFFMLTSALAIVALAAFGIDPREVTRFYSAPVAAIAGLATGLNYIYRRSQGSEVSQVWAESTLLAFGISVGHDFLFIIGAIHTGIILSTASITLLVITTYLIILNEIFRIQEKLKNHTEDITQALNEQRHELDITTKRTIKLERQRAISEEHTRLLSDLHDGVLGYLTTIYALAEAKAPHSMPQIKQLSRKAISEIRIILEAQTDETDASLFRTLSVLRREIIDPLKTLNVNTHWSMLPILKYDSISERLNLEIFRAAQELINNAHNRANCTHLSVTAVANSQAEFFIHIENSGGSTYDPKKSKARGLNNVRHRINRIGGRFSIEPREGGAKATIKLPNTSQR